MKKQLLVLVFMLTWYVILNGQQAVQPIGEGTEDSPYLIESWQNLNWINQDQIRWNKHYKQTADITFPDEITTWNNGKGWKKIGIEEMDDNSHPFTGVYDGDGYTISGLYMNYNVGGSFNGFFACIRNATIKNLGFYNVDILTGSYSGVLVGYVISSSTIDNCFAEGTITSTSDPCGGLVGYINNSTINNSYFIGDVSALSGSGGLSGSSSSSTISNSYFIGSITSENNSVVGGLSAGNSNVTYINSFYNYDTTLLNGENILSFGAINNDLFNEWLENDKYLNINDYLDYDGTNYQINNIDDFKYLIAFGQISEYNYILTADLDLSSEENLFIPYFTGNLNGNNKTISNCTLDSINKSLLGVFGYVKNATITDLIIQNSTISNAVSNVGFLIGYGRNINIINCNSIGNLTGDFNYGGGLIGSMKDGSIINSSHSGNVEGDKYVGGLIGKADGITEIVNCQATGQIGGDFQLGGLIGSTHGVNVTDCHSTTNVNANHTIGGLIGYASGTNISNSNATGNIIGTNAVGGLVGSASHTNIDNCNAYGYVSGSSYVGGITGNLSSNSLLKNSHFGGSLLGASHTGGLIGIIRNSISQNSYYNYNNVSINNQQVITVGALNNEMYNLWHQNDKILNIDDYLTFDGTHYLINNVNDFKQILVFGSYDKYSYKLMNDIDLSSEANFYIPYLTGDFIGNGYCISNVNVNKPFISNLGLFGYVQDSSIDKLGILNPKVKGNTYVGSLMGYGHNVEINNCFASFVSSSDISLNAFVEGVDEVGGLAGRIINSKMNNNYSNISSRRGSAYGSGLLYYMCNESTARDNYWDIETSGSTSSAAGLGKTTQQMKSQDTYAYWNFTYPWQIEPDNYPILQNQSEVVIEGDGTAESPYEIDNYYHLIWLKYNSSEWEKNFIQTSDINIYEQTETWNNCSGWYPIGSSDKKFNGHYNGNDHTISGLTINSEWGSYLGLFAYAGENSVISNLGLIDVDINGRYSLGSLVVNNEGLVERCYAKGIINGNSDFGGLIAVNQGIVNQCFFNGNLQGYDYAGGLVGYNYNQISQSFSKGNINASSSGGFVMQNDGLIENSYSLLNLPSGTCNSGFIYSNYDGIIENCYSIGYVMPASDNNGFTGSTSGEIINSFWDIESSGHETSAQGIGKTTEEMKDITTFTSVGWNFDDIWQITNDINQGYPSLQWEDVETSIDNDNLVISPNKTILYSAYPNPFNPSTTISFEISKKQMF
jgi:hypothetical protein